MPVGNSDNGVGLWAGQIMFALDNINQHIDWWHEPLDGPGEGFDHEGILFSTIFIPKVTLGLTNYWNITLSQSIGNRYMNWEGDTTTIHHRDESSHTSKHNAIGGYLGDSKIVGRYLVINDGTGKGKRFFLGLGMTIPSRNTLTSDPFFLSGEAQTNHRHFSLSEGVYKLALESQLFLKRNSNPVFYGGSINIEIPLKENKYGFIASTLYDFNLSALTKKVDFIKAALGFRSSLRYTTKAYWNGKSTPNSESFLLTIGGGAIWVLNSGTFGLNIEKPYFLKGAFAVIESRQKQEVYTWQVSLSYRKVFDFTIPWIDPLKKL